MKMKKSEVKVVSSGQKKKLWDGITEKDFENTDNIEDREIGEFDKENMILFAANTNLFRQIIRLSDSLKPVERRVLYALYQLGAKPRNKTKSAQIVATTMKYHPHGDSVAYGAMVNLAQPWKRACPLVSGKGNFGNAGSPDMFAHYRYTEAYMSKYAWECFFEDYDPECVETLFNSASDTEEPMALPSKFPNILVNGGFGIAFGNSFRIPPYNINDIIEKCEAVIKNPMHSDLYMIPDLPCDCDIIDDGTEMQNIIDTGTGILRMRGRIEIEQRGNKWALRIMSVPWMVNLQSVLTRIRELAKNGVISIVDIQDANEPVMSNGEDVDTSIDTAIIISNAHDPNVVRDKLYSLTDLEKSVAINFKVVTDNLTVDRMNMRDLILSWINERRSYKRRKFNKRLTTISARIELLDILIYLLQKDNINKTVDVIKNSTADNIEDRLRKLCKMSSYQAKRIGDMKLSAFTKDARKRYEAEKDRLEAERKEIMTIIKSEKKIDNIIIDELHDLYKYAKPRRTNVIEPSNGVKIADTEHHLIVSKGGYIKKLMYNGKYEVNMGSFKTNDYPIYRSIVHNMDSVIFFDSFGRYSVIPVHSIDNNEASQIGHTLFEVSKLSGRIVTIQKMIPKEDLKMIKKFGIPYMVTITSRGYIKKTPLETYLSIRNTKNIRCMKIRDDDSMVYAGIILEKSNIMVYTKKGHYMYLTTDSISEQAKDSMGLISMKLDPDDEVAGVAVIGKDDEYVGIVTQRGLIKKCETKYFGEPLKRSSSNTQAYLTTLETADEVISVIGLKENGGIAICTRTDVIHLKSDEMPVMTRKAKGKKMISLPTGTNIINVFEELPQKKK